MNFLQGYISTMAMFLCIISREKIRTSTKDITSREKCRIEFQKKKPLYQKYNLKFPSTL